MTHTSPAERASAPDSSRQEAAYTEAVLRWRALSADLQLWAARGGQRVLAAAFLQYHAAKLALEEKTGQLLAA